jgi:polysaccharide biosynthesis/export protein
MRFLLRGTICLVVIVAALRSPLAAYQLRAEGLQDRPDSRTGSTVVPADYLIGPQDVLSIVFWREKDLSADVVVRPDGKISLPLLKDQQAAGLTPDQLTEALVKAATKYVSQPNATVMVKEINSRKVFVVGQVAKPGTFPLAGDMTVLQVIALAGDVLEYAKASKITVVRVEGGEERRLPFNYKDVLKGKNIAQNIRLKPGDTIIVP